MKEPLTIYMASKTNHAPRWRDLRAKGVPIISTWIDEAGHGESPDKTDLWSRNVGEAMRAQALVAYVEPGEMLKGSLVEVGAALANDRPVLWVGPRGAYTVTYHPYVRLYDDLTTALRSLGVAS